jgi:hypothetical protein
MGAGLSPIGNIPVDNLCNLLFGRSTARKCQQSPLRSVHYSLWPVFPLQAIRPSIFSRCSSSSAYSAFGVPT